MAQDNIVGGIFGLTPELYQQNQLAQLEAQQRAAGTMAAGPGTMLNPSLAPLYAQAAQQGQVIGQGAKAIGGLLGIEDPQLRMVRDVTEMRKQFDVSTPTGLRQFAQALGQKGYTDLAIQASQKAADIDKELSQAEKNRTEKLPSIANLQLYRDRLVQAVGPNDPRVQEVNAVIKAEGEGKGTKVDLGGLSAVFDKAFTTQEGKDQAETWTKAGESYKDAAKVGRTVREMENIVGTAFVGPYGSLQTGLSRVFGGGKRLSDTEVFDALSSQLVTPLAKTLPGSLAVKELETLIKQKPNLNQSEPTIRRLLNQINQDIKASEITYEAGENYRAKNNGKISGFNPNIASNKATRLVELREKYNQKKQLSEAEKAEAKKIAEELNVKDL